MGKINRCWRFLAAALCFFAFGLGGLVLSLIVLPALSLVVRGEKKRREAAQLIIRRSFRIFVGLMKGLGAMDLKVEGMEVLERESGCIVVANHPTLIDYVLLAALLPRCVCIVKHAMWRNPFVKGVISAAGYLDNADPDVMLAKCAAELQSGNVLLVFPEGTRTVPGEKMQLKRGAAQIAVRTRSDIRVVRISCTPPYLHKRESWLRVPRQKPFFLVRAMEKVKIRQFIEEAPSPAAAARRATAYLEGALEGEPVRQEGS